MGGITRKAPLAGKGGPQAFEHLIKSLRQAAYFVGRASVGDALREIASLDGVRRARNLIDRAQGTVGQKIAAQTSQQQHQRNSPI